MNAPSPLPSLLAQATPATGSSFASDTACPVLKLLHALDTAISTAPRGALLVGFMVRWFEEAAVREVATSAVGLLFQLVVAHRIARSTLDFVPDRDERNRRIGVDRAHMAPDLLSATIKTFTAQGVSLPPHVADYYGLDGGCDRSESIGTTN